MSPLEEIMTTKLETVPGTMPVTTAAQKMRDQHIGSLLVEQNGEIVGIVTDTDIVRKAVAEGKDLARLTLADIMSTPLASIESVRSAHDAQDMMADLGTRHLVVRKGGTIVGLISARDLLVYYKSTSEPKIGID